MGEDTEKEKKRVSVGHISVAERAATEGVMLAWTRQCSMRAQAVLVAAIRGCDGIPKEDPSKAMLRALRYTIFNPSAEAKYDDPTKFVSFMGYVDGWQQKTAQWLDDLDPYPFHFVQHISHAAHIVAAYHPDPEIRDFWRDVYIGIVERGFHSRVEPDEEMIFRLRDR